MLFIPYGVTNYRICNLVRSDNKKGRGGMDTYL